MADVRALPLEQEGDAYLGRERGLWRDAFRRLKQNRLAMGSLVVLIGIVLLVFVGAQFDAIERYSPREQDYAAIHEAPSTEHYFGTDNLGRDTWSRTLQGLRISIEVGFGVALLILIIGMMVGGIAALGGAWLDNFMMRLTDLAYAFPELLFIILLRSVLFGRDWFLLSEPVVQMIVAISFVAWVTTARLVRGQMLSLKGQDFVIAARAMGAGNVRIVAQHMLPNTLGPVIVAVVFAIPLAIFSEAVLGFIGIGVPPPQASLGVLVSTGYTYISLNTWLAIVPAMTIGVLMLCFTFIGDGLRDALDPRYR
jgi:oligopeptide transport system permease protein